MPRPLVEHAGPAWHCGSLQRRCGFSRYWRGRVTVGPSVLAWEVGLKPFAVYVRPTHTGGRGETIRLLTTALPSGGERWWFCCPRCERRSDLLYQPSALSSLACRRCCGLAYRTQRVRATEPTRARRKRSTVRIEKTVTLSHRWGFPLKETTITLHDNSEPAQA